MTHFWLATLAASVSSASGDLSYRTLAVEVLNDGDDWAVLFSNGLPSGERDFTCFLAFTNSPQACNTWDERGFPIIDAAIHRDESDAHTLRIDCPCFRDSNRMEYESTLLRLHGVTFGRSAEPGEENTASVLWNYHQETRIPDTVQPDIWLTRRAITWTPQRSRVRRLETRTPVAIDLGPAAARSPSLALLAAPLKLLDAWCGEMQLPTSHEGRLSAERQRIRTADTFGLGAFRFENVEVLGFRIEVGLERTRELAALIEPLNFHLQPTDGGGSRLPNNEIPDFRYRAATHTIIIELLRYGAMKSRGPLPPLRLDDCQSQHELTVRVLVGRVDDDSTQARSPAIYVPAVFVDNPWSKALGRQFLGFDKRLARFFTPTADGNEAGLLPDGRLSKLRDAEQPVVPLGEISRIRLADRMGKEGGATLLELRYNSVNHTDPDAWEPIDLGLAMRPSEIATIGWRHSDFAEAAEFRHTFATRAIGDSLRAIRNIQVSPPGNFLGRDPNDKTWITGAFVLDDNLRFALPAGAANLTLHPIPEKSTTSAEDAWNVLCRLLGQEGETAEVVVPTGSWYRLLCSMDLTVDDGLDWDDGMG